MADQPLEVNLRILSQLPEPHDTLLIGPLPMSCSVAELKQKIRDLLPSAPLPDRQRLIYRGRPLTRDADTLLTIFGVEAVRQGERQILHLVLRETLVHRDGQVQTAARPPPATTQVTLPGPILPGPIPPGPIPPVPRTQQDIRQPLNTVLHQTPFANDPTRRQGTPSSPAVAQQGLQQLQQMQQQLHNAQLQLAQLRHNIPQQLGQAQPMQVPLPAMPQGNVVFPFPPHAPLPPTGMPGGVHGHIHPLHQHPQRMPQPVPAFHPFHGPGQHIHPPHMHPPPFRTPIPSQHNNLVSSAPQQQQQQEGSVENSQILPHIDTNSSINGPNVQHNDGTATRTVRMQADDPQAAMLGYMDNLYNSMGLPPQERERLRNLMATNMTGRQAGGVAVTDPHIGTNPVTISSEHSEGALQGQNEAGTNSSVDVNNEPPQPSVAQATTQDSAAAQHGTTATRQMVGPNGQRWTMTINASSLPFPPQLGLPPLFHPPHIQTGLGALPAPGSPASYGVAPFVPQHEAATAGWLGPVHAIDNMRRLQRELDHSSAREPDSTSRGQRPPHVTLHIAQQRLLHVRTIIQQRNNGQSVINAVLSDGPPAGHTGLNADHVATLQALNSQFRRDAENVTRSLERSITRNAQNAPLQATNNRHFAPNQTASRTVASSQETRQSGDVVAYLLSSPNGPHAVVYTPQGRFSSVQQNLAPRLGHTSLLQRQNPQLQSSGLPVAIQQQQGGQAANINANPPLEPGGPAGAVQQQLVLQQPFQPLQPQQAVDPERNALVIALTPFFRTIWFFARVCAFFWLFGGLGGTGFRRILIVTIISIIYHLYQIGTFRDQQAWLLQHWERLIGVPEAPRPGLAAGALPGQTATQRLQDGSLPPAETAQRLMNERRRRDRGWLRARITAIERAAALFIASLYPGVGERHVAERERVRREAEEERARAAAAAAAAAAVAEVSSTSAPPTLEGEGLAGADEARASASVKSSNNLTGDALQSADPAEGSSSSVAVRPDGDSQLIERRHGEH